MDQVRATVSCSSECKYSVAHFDLELGSLACNFLLRLKLISGEASQCRLVVKELEKGLMADILCNLSSAPL